MAEVHAGVGEFCAGFSPAAFGPADNLVVAIAGWGHEWESNTLTF
jgi:hypothetical protein